ncbi:hypothetical protein GCM10022254_16290 [Actinomadura meridiana]|uniref:Uncharacterized protein n=1 Tax=Actinomadura meridiana TaxID=559626 RepID=A0ABP8BWW7_9ACTN
MAQTFTELGCEIPKNSRTKVVACFTKANYEPVTPAAGSAAMPSCPAPSNKDEVYWTRTYACSHVKEIGFFYSITDRKLLGSAASNVAFEEWLDPASRAWKRTVYYQNIIKTSTLPVS